MDTSAAEPSSYSTFDTLCGLVFGTPGPGAKSSPLGSGSSKWPRILGRGKNHWGAIPKWGYVALVLDC